MENRQAHPTKKGPGRKHGQGVSHGKQPKPTPGAFLGQHKNPKRNAERAAMKAAGGKRAFRLHGARVQAAA